MTGGPYRWVQPEHRAWRSQPVVGAPRRASVPVLCGLWFIAGAGMATIVAVLVG